MTNFLAAYAAVLATLTVFALGYLVDEVAELKRNATSYFRRINDLETRLQKLEKLRD